MTMNFLTLVKTQLQHQLQQSVLPLETVHNSRSSTLLPQTTISNFSSAEMPSSSASPSRYVSETLVLPLIHILAVQHTRYALNPNSTSISPQSSSSSISSSTNTASSDSTKYALNPNYCPPPPSVSSHHMQTRS